MKEKNKGRFNISSIKGKLIAIVLPIVIVSVVFLLTTTFNISGDIIVDYGKDVIHSSSEANANEIETWIGHVLSSFDEVKNTLETVDFTPAQEFEYLKTTLDRDPSYPSGIYIGDDKGNFVDASGWEPPADYIITERDWYKEGLGHDKFTLGASYQDAETGEYVVSATSKVGTGKSTTRVMSVDIFLNEISVKVTSMQIFETGSAFLIDKNTNIIIAHQDPAMINLPVEETSENSIIAETAKVINNGDTNVFEVKYGSTDYMAAIATVENANWALVSYVPESEVLGELSTLTRIVMLMAVVGVLVLAIVIERVIHIIISPIKKLTTTIGQITDGDFTVNVDTKGKDEIGIMGRSLQSFIETMRGIITDIYTMSGQLNGQAEATSEVAEKLFDSAENQSVSMDQLNQTVEELAKSVSEIAENASTLALVASETGEKGKEASQKMNKTVEVSEKGKNDMEQINLAMGQVEKSIYSLETVVEEVGESTVAISEIITLIGNIATETNLLSLNAAIEAARAGEAGKGFAVVAEEIRKLADTSADAVGDISGLINKISTLIENTVVNTKESVESIKNSSDLIVVASETFGTVYSTVDETNTILQDMIEKVNNVDNVATSVAAITEEQSAATEEILATSEGLSEQSKNVTTESRNLEKEAVELAVTSENLENKLKIFKI